jgi:hypothetical protein
LRQATLAVGSALGIAILVPVPGSAAVAGANFEGAWALIIIAASVAGLTISALGARRTGPRRRTRAHAGPA